MRGIVLGCDFRQEWLLSWWWKNYSAHNEYPVVVFDFGMSGEGIAWCQEKEIYQSFSKSISASPKESLPTEKQKEWEARYGAGIWRVRGAWLKKPFALLESPFDQSLWIDLDAQVKGDVTPIFEALGSFDIAVTKDREQSFDFLLPGEVNYNSGVIAFRKEASIIPHFIKVSQKFEQTLPGDQEFLSRTIYLYEPSLIELPPIYNWYHAWGPNTSALIHHFCGGPAKVEILKSFSPGELYNLSIPKF
jgi:hypothetical protein